MSTAVSVVETVTARGAVWRIRCGGRYIDVGGRLVEMGTRTVTTETVDALMAGLRVAAGFLCVSPRCNGGGDE